MDTECVASYSSAGDRMTILLVYCKLPCSFKLHLSLRVFHTINTRADWFKTCFYNSVETQSSLLSSVSRAVDVNHSTTLFECLIVIMARAKRIYILMIKVNKFFFLFLKYKSVTS